VPTDDGVKNKTEIVPATRNPQYYIIMMCILYYADHREGDEGSRDRSINIIMLLILFDYYYYALSYGVYRVSVPILLNPVNSIIDRRNIYIIKLLLYTATCSDLS